MEAFSVTPVTGVVVVVVLAAVVFHSKVWAALDGVRSSLVALGVTSDILAKSLTLGACPSYKPPGSRCGCNDELGISLGLSLELGLKLNVNLPCLQPARNMVIPSGHSSGAGPAPAGTPCSTGSAAQG